jgi:DNA (cytosine-5)-methyltransferase 1
MSSGANCWNKILVGIDIDINCRKLMLPILKNAGVYTLMFSNLKSELEEKLNLQQNDDDLILIGCKHVSFQIINTDKTKSKESKIY